VGSASIIILIYIENIIHISYASII